MRIFFLLRSLNVGGAERQLIELVRCLAPRGHEITVATFYEGGALRPLLESVEGVRVVSLGKGGRWSNAGFLSRLWRLVRAVKPDVIYSFLEVAGVFALMTGKTQGVPVVWGVRNAYLDYSRYDWTARLTYRLSVWLSPLADGVIFNSRAGMTTHTAQGYRNRRMCVVPNGIDTQVFAPNDSARIAQRERWAASEDEIWIGLSGRLDPVKDHPTFLRAAALAAARRPDLRFVCVGTGRPEYAAELGRLAETLGLSGRVLWTQAGGDEMPAVYNALDMLVMASYGEGFPNVVGEAMACALPCVVTDVGDAAWMVGECGKVAPPRDPRALAEAMLNIADLPPASRHALGEKARLRAQDVFSLEQMAADTLAFLRA